jgi:cell division protein FtsI (penicillin-binding protein 3)
MSRVNVVIPAGTEERESPLRGRLVRLRMMLVGLTVSLWALVIGGRLVHVQVLGHESFKQMADRQSERTIKLDPRRGPILDRNGRHLAVSVDATSLYAVPSDVPDKEGTTVALARILGLGADDRARLLGRLRRDKAFVWVERKVSPSQARAVRELDLDGIGFLTENRRYYPKRELASQVLGYVGLDNKGMSGIEYAFDDTISGHAAQVVVRTDARRRPVGHVEKPSTEGQTVVLTLDETVQYVAESELERAMRETGAASGMVVVLEPRTGEVLALSNRPTFNPNRFTAYSSEHWKNRAVVDAYEPGSIFKVITAAAALQEQVVSPEEVIDCGHGFIQIARKRINDHKVFDRLSFRDVIAKSSDIGVIRVAQRLGREQLYRYVSQFGFGVPTGVELPGESRGILRPTGEWSALSLASISFGQEVAVTGLQMATAVAAVANGGYLMRPLVVSHLEDHSGRVVKEWKPFAVRRVLDPQTVDVLTELLKEVVRSGTGRRAAVPGYVVAGKTGTAQKVDATGGYSMIDHVASFVGFVPASHPALVILVSLDRPRGLYNQGGDVAAPVFARIAEQALRHLAVPPDDRDRVLQMLAYRTDHLMPAAHRSEPVPAEQWDLAEPTLMPDLTGRSAREAAVAAARRGLIVELRGSGWVVGQSPAPGAEVGAGMTCVLSLGRPDAPTGAS